MCLIVGIRPPINVSINKTTIQVEPGRQLHIVCESLGEYRGDVEWKQVNDSGILMNTLVQSCLYSSLNSSCRNIFHSN